MSATKDKLIGLATPNYLGEQFSDLNRTMEENVKYIINECSATSQVTFPEDYSTPQFFGEDGEPFTLGYIALEGNTIAVYDDDDEYVGEFGYMNYDTQLALYATLYDYISSNPND